MTFSLRSAGLLLVAGGVAFAVGCSGCGPGAGPKATSTSGTVAATDPWPKFVSAVRNNPDPKAARAAVAELTAGLTNAAPADRPTVADPEYVATVTAALKLTDAEKRYVAGSEFTPLDANHLSECLYLTDVAAGLGVVSADPPAERADAAFRFVVRQLVLAPSVYVRTGNMLPPVPPTFVLGRGSGTGLERAVTFIALCRQLDLDAYLIGPPQAADQPWTHQGTAAADQPPNGPFWAVGVRAKEGVLLFDPWRGEAVPGKAVGRPITLAELKADSSACPWMADKAKPWVTADAIKEGGLFLSPPLAALSPRMARLQEKLKDGVGVQLAVDWPAAVKAAEAASGDAKAWGWNPPNDKFTPVRALGSFLSLEQGGLDPTPPQKVESVFFQYDYARLPIDRLQRPPVALGNRNAKEALSAMAAVTYREAFLAAPSPRERIQRGQYNAAVGHLLNQQDVFTTQLRGSAADDEALKEWYSNLSGVFNRVTQAQGTADEAAARAGVDKFLQTSGRYVLRAIGGMIADAVVGEIGYLLALAAHEQAEAAEAVAVRVEREGGGVDARKAAKEQWTKAANGWRRYAPYADAQEVSFPGRKAAADALAARADKLK